MNKEQLLAQIDGRSENEIRQILQDNYNISWEYYDRTRKFWYARVFTYNSARQLQEELDFFLWLVNYFAPIFNFCFQEEDTVFLGCTCPCGYKQTILYYSITRAN
ncbi:hypothetical protein [Konateibacter massiliensis]|uniref:hypothetical protein n=1 Tax=Konateibacter massiliensis TaxID=2002841 RepID=UPI000C14960B|nr:hypothetical protein [Konateibacter massiliensis]